MKKSILAVAGVAAFAGIAMPVAGAFALDHNNIERSDMIQLTIEDNCAFIHKANGQTAATTVISDGAWKNDVFSGTVANGQTYSSFATSTYNVVCNNQDGYQVTAAAEALTDDDNTDAEGWAYNKSGLTLNANDKDEDASVWTFTTDGVGADQEGDNNIVLKEEGATASTDVVITYSAKVSSTQEAGQYKATATYTFAQL